MKVVFDEIIINDEVPEKWRMSVDDVKEKVVDALECVKDFIPLLSKHEGICVYPLGDFTVEFNKSGDGGLFFIVVEYEEGYIQGVQKRIEHAWGTIKIIN